MRTPLASVAAALTAVATLSACGAVQQPPPATATTTTPSASPTPSGPDIPANWVKFDWPEAGLGVTVPATPVQHTSTHMYGKVETTIRLGVVQTAEPIEVGGTEFAAKLTSAQIPDALHYSIAGFAAAYKAPVSEERATTFQGLTARTAILTLNQRRFVLLIVAKDRSHTVFIVAREGGVYQAVLKSLRLL